MEHQDGIGMDYVIDPVEDIVSRWHEGDKTIPLKPMMTFDERRALLVFAACNVDDGGDLVEKRNTTSNRWMTILVEIESVTQE